MSPITTHILDTSRGRPAEGVPVVLYRRNDSGQLDEVGRGVTDGDGRNKTLLASGALERGTYKLTFDTASYFASTKTDGFFPEVSIVFTIRDEGAHYHVPLLLNPYGYSTYRGS